MRHSKTPYPKKWGVIRWGHPKGAHGFFICLGPFGMFTTKRG